MVGPADQQAEAAGQLLDSAPEQSPTTVMRRYDVERSCIRCHARKVRCDKGAPCTTCVRARVPCRYPGPERAKRRSQRSTSAKAQEVVPRLELLERAVAAIKHPECISPAAAAAAAAAATGHVQTAVDATSHTTPVGPAPDSDTHTADTAPPSAPSMTSLSAEAARVGPSPKNNRDLPLDPEQSGGFLLKEGSSTRYINESTFSSVLEKQGEYQSVIETPESSPLASSDGRQSALPIGFDGLISDPRVSNDILALFPSRWQATQLWQVYLNNVDGVVKLLHIPTVQPTLFAAINKPNDTPLDMVALLFSIYHAAITSLRPPDVQIMLGKDRQAALGAYQRGLEVSLHMGQFLDSPTIVSLQALAIYLMCRRNSNSGRSGWILNGLLIRAAQSLGLHRDGTHFNLLPLECEIRRRLWWQILGSDGRVAEDHGLTGGFDGFCDTKLPTHIDDRDISSSTTAALAPQPRWTEMTHFLVASEMYQTLQEINRLSMLNDKMTHLKKLLITTKDRMQSQYLQHCDANIPIQRCALLLGRLLMGKFEVFVRQQELHGLNAEESAARATEDTLALACDTIELGIEMKTDELLNNFQWLFSTFTEYHLLTYTLWHLCVRPGAFGVDRAWAVVIKLFTLVDTQGWPTPGTKWNVLRKLKDRAADIRQSFHHSSTRNMEAVVDLAVPPQQAPSSVDAQLLDQAILDAAPMFADGMLWDLDALCFPEWSIPASGF